MEQHAIPRQITSFEFKLIGFMTLRQFLYLVLFIPLGYITYMIFPIPLLNILVGFAVAALGVALAFVPINDRPLDIWIKNAWKRFNSPTQFTYHKHNAPIALLQNLYYVADPHHVMAHIESQQMLAAYMAKTQQTLAPSPQKKQIQQAFQHVATPQVSQTAAQDARVMQVLTTPVTDAPAQVAQPAQAVAPETQDHKPFFVGAVKNGKRIGLPGILLYVKNTQEAPVRLLKTNQHGIFATFNPLPPGEYTFEIKNPKNTYFFDTMKIAIQNTNSAPLEFYSKELM